MPIEVMEEFARDGWIGLGWQIGRDSMPPYAQLERHGAMLEQGFRDAAA
jgi:hypothetical protein